MTTGQAGRRLLPWAIAVVAVALAVSATSVGNGFTQDDVPIIAGNARVHELGSILHRFAESYWPPEVGAVLYRPLAMVAYTVEWAVGRGEPWAFHLTSWALAAALAGVLLLLFRELLPPVAAGAATLLFAVHPVHTEAIGGVVGQADLWVALALAWATLLYLRGRQAQRLGRNRWAAIVALAAAAVFTKENGAVLLGLLAAVELTVVRDPHPLGSRLRHLWPGYAACALVVLAYVAARIAVLGGLVGEIPHVSIRTAGLGERVLTMLPVVIEWLRLLFLPAHLQSDYMPQELAGASGFGAGQLLGLLALVGAAWLAWRTRRSAPVVTLGVVWMGVTLFPVSNLAVRTGILLAERTLLVPSIGAVLVAVGLVEWRLRVGPVPSPAERRVAWAAFGMLLAVAGAWHAVRLRVWRDNPTLYAQTVLDAPLSYKAHWAQAGMLYRTGQLAEAQAEYRTALQLFTDDPNLLEDYADRYVEHGRCAEALPWLRAAIAAGPTLFKARSKLVLCLIQVDSVPAARAAMAAKAEAKDPDFVFLSRQLDSVLTPRAP